MANSKHISEDEIKYIVDVESAKAQQEIRELEKESANLRAENKRRLDQLIKLEAAGKKQSQQYKDLKKNYVDTGRKIKQYSEQIAENSRRVKVNDLTMNQLKKQAKQLQKQLDDTSKSLNPAAYKELEGRLSDVTARMAELKADATKVKEVFNDMQTQSFLLGSAIFEMGKRVAGFIYDHTIGTMRSFISEGIDMAESADGITHAFNRLNKPGLLDNLRAATKGAVNDVELMKAAVKAKDFRIPLEDLGKYLAFAQMKAQQTGESLDYMVDSIVTGLGRQSPQILDNLGLSAAEIKEQTKQTGDFMKAVANIVEKNLAQAADNYVSASDRAAKAQVRLQNKQRELGEALLPLKEKCTDIYGSVVMSIADVIKWLINNKQAILLVTAAFSVLAVTTMTATGKLRQWVVESKMANAVNALGTTIVKGYHGVVALFSLGIAKMTGNTQKATVAMEALNKAGKANTIGILIAAFMLLIPAITAAANAFKKVETEEEKLRKCHEETAREIKKQNEEMERSVAESTADEIARIKQLSRTIHDSSRSYNERKAAIAEMQTIIPGYHASISSEGKLFNENTNAIRTYVDNLLLAARAQAAFEKAKENEMKIIEAQMAKRKAETNLELTYIHARSGEGGVDFEYGEDVRHSGPWAYNKVTRKGNTYTYSNISNEAGERAFENRRKIEGYQLEIKKQQDVIDQYERQNKQLQDIYDENKQHIKNNPVTTPVTTPKGTGRHGSANAKDPDTDAVEKFKKARQEEIDIANQFYKQEVNDLDMALARKKITQQQYDIAIAQLKKANAQELVDIEQCYADDSQNISINDAKKKKQLSDEQAKNLALAKIAQYEQAVEAERQYQSAIDRIMKEGELKQKLTLEQEQQVKLETLEAYYQAALQMAINAGEDESEVTKAYESAKATIIKDYAERTAQAQLQARQKHGLLSEKEHLEQELKDLKDDYDKKLLTKEQYEKATAAKEKEYEEKRKQQRIQLGVERQNEYRQQVEELQMALEQQLITQEEYEQRVAQLKRESWKKQFDYYQQLFGSAFQALQDAELANVDAKYDAQIEAARQAGQDTAELEKKKANEQLKIQKKYADVNFAIKASEIIANTAVSIMKALSELGPIAGPIAAALMGVTGAAQLAAANAERQKVKKMTLNGASGSASAQGTRVATGLEEGGTIDITRRQDGKQFQAKYDPARRGYIDRPTVIVGEGPAGKSREWVASNAALANPTVAPLIDIIDRAQRVGNISTLDMRKYLLQQQARGLQQGGYLGVRANSRPSSAGRASDAPSPNGQTNNSPNDQLQRLCAILERIDAHGIHSYVALDEFDAQQKLRNQSRHIASK